MAACSRHAPGLVGPQPWMCAHVQEVSAARWAALAFWAAVPVGGVLARHSLRQRLYLRLQLGDARVAWILLRHRDRRSCSSRSVDPPRPRSEEHTSELHSRENLV